MMDRRGSQVLWAGVLILGGVILLLLNFGVLEAYEPVAHYVVAGALALGGIAFFASSVSSGKWQRVIPAWTLIALAVMVLLGEAEVPNGRLIAASLFWGLAAAFLHIWLQARRDHWWALIPGGFLLVLGTVVAISGMVQNLETLAAILFAGIGLVFVALYFARGTESNWWALLPGSILLLFAAFVLTGSELGSNGVVRWWPVLALLAGVFVLWRAFAKPASTTPEFERHHAPAPATMSAMAAAEKQERLALGEYTQPAQGATVDVLPDVD